MNITTVQPVFVTIALGTNVTTRLGHIQRTVRLVNSFMSIRQKALLYTADAMLKPNAPASWNQPFYNTVLSGYTTLSPQQLLKRIKQVETTLGRSPFHASWSPRTIDVDIITYGTQRMAKRQLQLPHPHAEKRSFVVKPLAQIAPFARLYTSNALNARTAFLQKVAEGELDDYSARKTLIPY